MLSTTSRTTLGRGKKRARTSRDDLYAVLDAGLICHLGVVVDGYPMVIPTGYGRIGDTLYLHGSTGAASLRAGGSGGEICVTVTHLDGIVLARSVFNHSVNYRSAMIYGRPRLVEDPEERLAACARSPSSSPPASGTPPARRPARSSPPRPCSPSPWRRPR
nr:hypothetical protein GCM10020093_052630 [Planobispora longispora]